MNLIKDSRHIEAMVKCFANDTSVTRDEIALEYGLVTSNFKNFMAWDFTFGKLAEVLCKETFEILMLKRGNWKFIAPLHIETGTLYIFTKQQNLKIVERNLNLARPHYFYSLISKNGEAEIVVEYGQLKFEDFSANSDIEILDREAMKILGNSYSKVKQVLLVVGSEQNKKITDVSVHLYNQDFMLADVVNWSEHINNVKYEDILPSAITLKDTDEEPKIATLKKEFKKKNESLIKPKQNNEKNKEDNKNSI